MLAPSLLSADFARLADSALAVPNADWLHVDVMDNHFVPNLTIGLPVVQSLRGHTELPLDCHLMIDDPDRWAPPYAESGAHNVTVHVEAAADPVQLARTLRAAGALAGLAVKPGTPLEPYLDLLREYDTLLVMTVEPGFGGRSEEHTSELQSRENLVCRLLLEKKQKNIRLHRLLYKTHNPIV